LRSRFPIFLQKIKKICIFLNLRYDIQKDDGFCRHFEEGADLWKSEKHSENPLT